MPKHNSSLIRVKGRMVTVRWSMQGVKRFLTPCNNCTNKTLHQILQVNNIPVNSTTNVVASA